MQLEFVRINQAISFTLEFYEIGKIKDYLLNHFSTDWHEFVYKTHEYMENEINQIIHTTNKNTQVYVFETLKEWLQDVRIERLNSAWIAERIDTYNKKTLAEYELKIEKEVEQFQQTWDYKNRAHLEEYEIDSPGFEFMRLPRRSKKINYKFYCIEKKPELIDPALILEYLPIVTGLISNFRGIVSKYVKLYDEGKISPASDVLITLPAISPDSITKMIEPPKENKKLKSNLTVEQLAYLFKKLHEVKIIEASTLKEVQEFIATNFISQGKSENEPISTTQLRKFWTDFSAKTAGFWSDKFIELHNESKKDNPNKIK